MTLLLTSQGLPKEISETFLSLLKKPANECSVAFITTAALDRGDDNPSWLEFYRQELRGFGITDIEDIDLRGYETQTLKETLADKDIIFVNGGNTFYLMKYVHASGFGDLLPTLLQQHALYIGVSAGSVIMGPDIALASWILNDEDINDGYVAETKGLGLVPFGIWPHFQQSQHIVLEKNTKSVSYPVIALDNTQAVLWKDNSYTIIGGSEKRLYGHE